MAKLILSADPASRRPNGIIMVSFGVGQSLAIQPDETVDARTAADAVAALQAYAEKVKATGTAARASMRLARGERAPRGFKAVEHEIYVNL